MEETNQNKWNIGTACKKLVKWDKKDWIWVFFTIALLVLSYLYWTETRVARQVYSNLPHTCEIYNALKQQEINNGTKLEDINLSHLGELTIKNVTG